MIFFPKKRGGELANGANSARGTLLEGGAVKALVEVDGVLAGDTILTDRLGFVGWHIWLD